MKAISKLIVPKAVSKLIGTKALLLGTKALLLGIW
jgi:hypothetical protein